MKAVNPYNHALTVKAPMSVSFSLLSMTVLQHVSDLHYYQYSGKGKVCTMPFFPDLPVDLSFMSLKHIITYPIAQGTLVNIAAIVASPPDDIPSRDEAEPAIRLTPRDEVLKVSNFPSLT